MPHPQWTTDRLRGLIYPIIKVVRELDAIITKDTHQVVDAGRIDRRHPHSIESFQRVGITGKVLLGLGIVPGPLETLALDGNPRQFLLIFRFGLLEASIVLIEHIERYAMFLKLRYGLELFQIQYLAAGIIVITLGVVLPIAIPHVLHIILIIAVLLSSTIGSGVSFIEPVVADYFTA